MIKRITCKVVGSAALGKSSDARCSERLNKKHPWAGGIIAGNDSGRYSSSIVEGLKTGILALGHLTYTRRLADSTGSPPDIQAAFGGDSTGRILDYYA